MDANIVNGYTLAPAQILVYGESGSWHNAFPGLARLPSGRLIIAYRSGSQHVGGTPGVIRQMHSDDSGATWSTPTTILTDTNDLRDPALMLLSDGRLAMTLFPYNQGWLGAHVSYSSDGGATWSAPSLLPFTFTGWHACSGPIVEPEPGVLLAFAYGQNSGATRSSIAVLTSTDNGATWGDHALLMDGPTDGRSWQEPFGGMLNDGRVMLDVRDGSGTAPARRRLIRSLAGTWSGPTSLVADVQGRPAWLQTSGGTIIVADRIISSVSGMSVIATQDDEAATLGAWTDLTTDPLHDYGTYQQMVELGGGVVGVAFCYELSNSNSRLAWTTLTPATDRRRAVAGLI